MNGFEIIYHEVRTTKKVLVNFIFLMIYIYIYI
jgi:hypothetical protein